MIYEGPGSLAARARSRLTNEKNERLLAGYHMINAYRLSKVGPPGPENNWLDVMAYGPSAALPFTQSISS